MNDLVCCLLGCLFLLAISLETSHATLRAYSCVDSNSHCGRWAQQGYCRQDHYMISHCRLSCKLCSSTSASSTTSFTESSDCLHNSHYNHLKSLAGNDCLPMDNQWYYLYHLTHTSGLEHCARDAAKYLRDYYQHHHADSDCSCSVHGTSLTTAHKMSGCSTSYAGYRDIADTTFNSNHNSLTKRTCQRHVEVWEKLADISSNNCFMNLVRIFDEKLFVHNDHRCTCQTSHGGGGATTTAQPHHHTVADPCMDHHHYRYIDALLANDTCISHDEVWSHLDYMSVHQLSSCRVKIIDKLNNAYGGYSQTPSKCTCATNFDSLQFINDPNGRWGQCRSDSHYNALTSRLLTLHSQVCSSHHTVWHDLANIPHYHGHTNSICQRDAISHLANSVSHVQNPCKCVPAVVASTTVPTLPPTTKPTTPPTTPPSTVTTLPTTTIPTLPAVKVCNTIALTVGLAYGEVLKEGNSTCSDGSHALSEAAPMRLCNAPDSSTWIKGQQVISHCDTIPMYSAIASFAGSVYTHDGLAGVFMGCNSTHITVASEDCTHGLSLFYIPKDGRDSYVHSGHNYYTIMW